MSSDTLFRGALVEHVTTLRTGKVLSIDPYYATVAWDNSEGECPTRMERSYLQRRGYTPKWTTVMRQIKGIVLNRELDDETKWGTVEAVLKDLIQEP